MTLIVPDIHEEITRLEFILNKYKHIKDVVFLGDWFDKFGEENVKETANWLKSNLDNPNYTFLLGNHDQHYLFGIEKCSGFSNDRNIIIKSILNKRSYIEKFKLVHTVDNYLLSHAGVDMYHIAGEYDYEALSKRCDKALQMAGYGEVHPLVGAGISRCGNHAIGGVNWEDFGSLNVIPGVNQICGHTYRPVVRHIVNGNNINYCIDTGLNHVALVSKEGCIIEEVPC